MLGGFEDEPPLTKAYNFMYERPSTVGEVLSDLTLSMAEEMQDIILKNSKEGEEEEEEYSSVSVMTNVSVNVIGACILGYHVWNFSLEVYTCKWTLPQLFQLNILKYCNIH